MCHFKAYKELRVHFMFLEKAYTHKKMKNKTKENGLLEEKFIKSINYIFMRNGIYF